MFCIVKVASSSEQANTWSTTAEGHDVYYVDPYATEFSVSKDLEESDARLSFHIGTSFLRLESLDLEGAPLPTFPDEFLNCQTLMEIQCRNVGLYNLSNTFGTGLQSLIKLNFSKNNLKDLPKSIGDLSSLKVLDVSDNWLSTLPDEIWNLKKMEALTVRDNVLIALPRKGIHKMKELIYLDCSNNKLSDAHKMPKSLLELPSLEWFCLHGNLDLPNILICDGNESCSKHWEVDMESGAVSRMMTNKEIAVAPNKFYLVCSRVDPPLTSLKLAQLNLQFVPKSIFQLDSLTELVVSNSFFCDLPHEIGNLKNLQSLDISNNPCIKSFPLELKDCPNLQTVIVKDCLYCTDLLKSLDITFNCKGKLAQWKDRPPFIFKLFIKLLVCLVLLVMSTYTIGVNIMIDSKCETDDLTTLDYYAEEKCKIDQAAVKEIPSFDTFKCFAIVVSLLLLVPHSVDVGTMMDHMLQVPVKEKFHKILELQNKLVNRVDFFTIVRHNWWGFWSSYSNLCCFFLFHPTLGY